MTEKKEKRVVFRLTHRKYVEISLHGRNLQPHRGELYNSSEAGIGLISPVKLKPGDIILLRLQSGRDARGILWPSEGGPFQMVSAKVRWCEDDFAPDGTPGYRIGVERLLPYY